MEVQEYLDKMNEIQALLLEYIDEEDNSQEKIKIIIKLFKDQKILDNKHQLTSVLYLLRSIIDYHYRTTNFFEKIFKIIQYLKEGIKKYYLNSEIYNIFNNKRIILFLLQEKILMFDLSVFQDISIGSRILDTGLYLFPEIKQFLDEETIEITNIPQNITKCRDIEYYDNIILQYIQKDLIDEFISYVNKFNIEIDQKIPKTTIFETNVFLIENENQKPIEYAAFYGSVKIFKYLVGQKCTMDPKLWLYAIHGRNAEIIHILEEYQIKPSNLKECLSFSIKCHHDELTNYILSNYVEKEENTSFILKKSLKYYNFTFIQPELINSNSFFILCKRNYYILASQVLKNDKEIDINLRKLSEKTNQWNNVILKNENTALFDAVRLRNFDIIHLLLENNDINANKKSLEKYIFNNECEITPLCQAIKRYDSEMVKFLLDHKNVDVNMKSKFNNGMLTPLFMAIGNGSIEIIKLLLNRVDIEVNLKSIKYDLYTDEESDWKMQVFMEIPPLIEAVKKNNIEIVKLLLDHKDIDVNAIVRNEIMEQDEHYFTERSALYEAVYYDTVEIIRLLINQEKIDVNYKAKTIQDNQITEECSILERAIQINNPEVIKLLQETIKNLTK